ncbi:MAG: thioredoxin-disulfide reductase [Chloroflexi bacterium]|nr:thioredoxin-disulfide reductase [Chloroflexota bacterium]
MADQTLNSSQGSELYDVVILGGGPGGLTAALYTARSRLKTLVVEKGIPGGQAATTFHVENYPGFPDGVSGMEISQLMERHATRFGAEITYDEIVGLEDYDQKVKVVRGGEASYRARALIIATGAEQSKLGVPGEEFYRGRGVSYCATCDGAFFRDKVVAVIGGGDSAVEEGDFLTRYASKVIIIHRRDALRAAKVIQERALANPKIEFCWNSTVQEIRGDDFVKSLMLRNVKTAVQSHLPAEGVFVYVGLKPNSEFLKGIIQLDAGGYVIANEEMETNVAGIFAIGDVTKKSLRQIITAAGDGAVAAMAADRYLHE